MKKLIMSLSVLCVLSVHGAKEKNVLEKAPRRTINVIKKRAQWYPSTWFYEDNVGYDIDSQGNLSVFYQVISKDSLEYKNIMKNVQAKDALLRAQELEKRELREFDRSPSFKEVSMSAEQQERVSINLNGIIDGKKYIINFYTPDDIQNAYEWDTKTQKGREITDSKLCKEIFKKYLASKSIYNAFYITLNGITYCVSTADMNQLEEWKRTQKNGWWTLVSSKDPMYTKAMKIFSVLKN